MTEPTIAAGLQPKRLIERAKRGDRRAFIELYDVYRTPIFRYLAYQMGGDVERAQDACEAVFLEALRGMRTYPSDVPFVAWVYRLANKRLASAGLLRPATAWPRIPAAGHGRQDDLRESHCAGHHIVG